MCVRVCGYGCACVCVVGCVHVRLCMVVCAFEFVCVCMVTCVRVSIVVRVWRNEQPLHNSRFWRECMKSPASKRRPFAQTNG